MADLDENIIRRSLPFGVDTSIGAVETHASENLILHDSEICDYSDRLLVRKVTADKVLDRLKGEGGTVLKTSLDHTKEAALQAALAEVKAAVSASPPDLPGV